MPKIEILEAKVVGKTDLNLSSEYHETQDKIAKAIAHIGDMDILILKANYPDTYESLLDIEATLEDSK